MWLRERSHIAPSSFRSDQWEKHPHKRGVPVVLLHLKEWRETLPCVGYTIRGEVLRVEGTTYVVKRQDGKEVSWQTDQTREKPDIAKEI